MSYDPRRQAGHPFGYVRATATVGSTSINQIVFDLPSDADTSVSNGQTSLPSESLCIMRLGRNDDASGEGRYWHAPLDAYSAGLVYNNRVIIGLLNAVTNNDWHGPSESFAQTDTITPYQLSGSGSVDISDWSHVMYWRLG